MSPLITLARPVPMNVSEFERGWLCQGGERRRGIARAARSVSGGSWERPERTLTGRDEGSQALADCEEVKPELVGARVFRGLGPVQKALNGASSRSEN